MRLLPIDFFLIIAYCLIRAIKKCHSFRLGLYIYNFMIFYILVLHFYL